jgi:MFS family permease
VGASMPGDGFGGFQAPLVARRLPFFYGWIIVALSALISFLGGGMFSYTRGIFLPSLADTFGGRFEVALAFSIEAVVAAAFAPLLGRMLDRKSPRVIMAVGVVIVSSGYGLLSLCETRWQLYLVLGTFFALGLSAVGNLSWQKVVVSWFLERRGFALALGVMGASLAGVFMPPVANWLVASLGWRGGFQVYGATVLLVLFPLLLLLMRDTPGQVGEVMDGRIREGCSPARIRRYESQLQAPSPAVSASNMVSDLDTAKTLRSSAFWAITVVFSAMLGVLGVVLLHLYSHLLDIGLTAAQAAFAMSLMAGAAAAGKPLVGWLSDVVGPRRTIQLSLVMQALALVVLVLADTAMVAIAAVISYGVGYSGVGSLQSLAVGNVFGSAAFARVRGLMTPFMLPLTATASPFAGFIYDVSGSYALAFLILSGLLLLVMIGTGFVPASRSS